jgi:glycosyltransferase involved in cell wall biosynthesis
MAMNATIEGLTNAGHQVKVLALNTNKYFIRPKDIPKEYADKTHIEFVFLDLSIKPIKAFLNLFTSKSFHVERFISAEFAEKIVAVLEQDTYDIVQLEMLYMTPYINVIRKHSTAKIILRSHNVEHLIWERVTAITTNPVKKWYLAGLTRKLKNYERNSINQYDGIATISKKDALFYLENNVKKPVEDIPFGIDIDKYPDSPVLYEFPSLFHLGSMNWMPNEEGIKWFIETTWPLVSKKFPDLKLYLAGRMMPEWLENLSDENIEVVGEVEDAQAFINSKAIMIVPLFSGSGIRIKIIEGMALGKAIISTDIGAEGISFTPDQNILIANTQEEFVDAIGTLVSSKEFCDKMGANAREVVANHHDLSKITQKLISFYQRVLEN